MESNTTGSNSFSWSDVDWDALRRLRARFLDFDRNEGDAGKYRRAVGPLRLLAIFRRDGQLRFYLRGTNRLEMGHDTRGTPNARPGRRPGGTVLDWGCGTGVAGRRVVAAWPDAARKLVLWDRSEPGIQFAAKRARQTFPSLVISPATAATIPDLLVISHVINELSPAALEGLVAVIEKAQAVLWVEPGTFQASRKLIAVRERLREKFTVIAPCTHARGCGMLAAGNERHWCHHFARIPGYVHTDPGWGRFSAALEIDISTLPYSYLYWTGGRRPSNRSRSHRA